MANPQKEDGHVRIANEIFDALICFRIPGEARQVLDFVIRKTYGYSKKTDYISLSQFCLATKLAKRSVSRALQTLKKMNIIGVKIDTHGHNFYGVNKDFDTWKRVTNLTGVTNLTVMGVKNDHRGVSKTRNTINNITTNNITINTPLPPKGETEVKKKLIFWLKGFEKIQNPTAYAEKIINKYSSRHIIKAMNSSLCTSPSQLSMLLEHYKKS